jgi:hypothetical protein
MSSPMPVSLSDGAMIQVMRLVEPLAPPDRSAFLHALAQLLRSEPVQPPGDGIVHRHARQLLSTGHYKLSSTFAAGRSAIASGTASLRSAGRDHPVRTS